MNLMRPVRKRGLSVRWKLTLSYAGFLMVAGILLLGVVWLFLLRYVPDTQISDPGGFVPNRTDLIEAFAPRAAGALVVLLVVGLAGGWILAGRMLNPLRAISTAARQVAEGDLSGRVRMAGRHDELRELADTFDVMLSRLEAHVAEQQRFAANASHELRTPLAISQTILDVARHDPDADRVRALERLSEMNTRAIDLTEALLALSRAGRTITEGKDVDLSLLADDAVETLAPLATTRSVALDISGGAAVTRGDPALLAQLVMNLTHNAIVHNTGPEGFVRLRTGRSARAAVIDIENTGPDLTRQRLATLVEPFQRGSNRARDDSHPGSGLGLAIAARIVDAHAGALTLTPRRGGGLHAHVELTILDPGGGSAAERDA